MISKQLKKAGLNSSNVRFTLIDALQIDDIGQLTRTFGWKKGEQSLLECVQNLRMPKRAVHKPLRLLIDSVFKIGGIYPVACGKIESGQLSLNCKTIVIGNGQKESD